MNRRNPAYIDDVDTLVHETSLGDVLDHFGRPRPETSRGEHRMPCVFGEACSESNYGQLTVRVDDPAKRIYAHCCGVRGNLLTLIHGLQHGSSPAGGRLRGDEFRSAVETLRIIHGGAPTRSTTKPLPPPSEEQPFPIPEENVSLVRHENERARAIADLVDDLVVDVSEMTPSAGGYFRQRPWMTPDVLREWGIGYLPRDGRSMFRGWVVYTHRNKQGEVISYSGRDASFEEKLVRWERAGRDPEKRPLKHKFVKGYLRGLELYGQQVDRLRKPSVRESLAEHGLVVCEGMNDVVRLDTLGVAAVGVCSNRATEEQIAKIVRFAREAAENRVLLLPDCDEEGERGFRELLWRLHEERTAVRLACSRRMHRGRFAETQPESLDVESWRLIAGELSTSA